MISERFAAYTHLVAQDVKIVIGVTAISLSGFAVASEIHRTDSGKPQNMQMLEDPSCTTLLFPNGKIARVALNKVEIGPNLPDNIRCQPLR